MSRRMVLGGLGAAAVASTAARPGHAGPNPPLYFPGRDRAWQSSDPLAAGWNPKGLDALKDYVMGQQRSTGFLMLQQGKLLLEWYGAVRLQEDFWRVAPRAKLEDGRYGLFYYYGTTPEGWPVEDVASIQKSVTSILTGVAGRKKLVDINRSVTSYIGGGWSKAPREREAAITVRHLLAMASGLDERLQCQAPAGTHWFYNTTAYGRLDDVLEAATGRTLGELTREWLTTPVAMTDSRWEPRLDGLTTGSNNTGFVTTPRDLARFGLLMLNGGLWDGRDVIADPQWLKASFSQSQPENPAYGYLWWLNSGAYSYGLVGNQRRKEPLVPTAPVDMIAGIGHFTRRLYVVPSLSLVVVRLGPTAHEKAFDRDVWARIMTAAPGRGAGAGEAGRRSNPRASPT